MKKDLLDYGKLEAFVEINIASWPQFERIIAAQRELNHEAIYRFGSMQIEPKYLIDNQSTLLRKNCFYIILGTIESGVVLGRLTEEEEE